MRRLAPLPTLSRGRSRQHLGAPCCQRSQASSAFFAASLRLNLRRALANARTIAFACESALSALAFIVSKRRCRSVYLLRSSSGVSVALAAVLELRFRLVARVSSSSLSRVRSSAPRCPGLAHRGRSARPPSRRTPRARRSSDPRARPALRKFRAIVGHRASPGDESCSVARTSPARSGSRPCARCTTAPSSERVKRGAVMWPAEARALRGDSGIARSVARLAVSEGVRARLRSCRSRGRRCGELLRTRSAVGLERRVRAVSCPWWHSLRMPTVVSLRLRRVLLSPVCLHHPSHTRRPSLVWLMTAPRRLGPGRRRRRLLAPTR